MLVQYLVQYSIQITGFQTMDVLNSRNEQCIFASYRKETKGINQSAPLIKIGVEPTTEMFQKKSSDHDNPIGKCQSCGVSEIH